MGYALLVPYLLLWVLSIAIFLRFILGWLGMLIPPLINNGFYKLIVSVSEPIMAPFRPLMPAINGIDLFSFIFASIMVQIMLNLVGILANAGGRVTPF